MESQKYDLIIMGGGLAGLSAGVRACELGLSVALVEKGETDQPMQLTLFWRHIALGISKHQKPGGPIGPGHRRIHR